MWDKVFMLILMVVTLLLWKVTQKENSKQKYYSKVLLYYIYCSALAVVLTPFFLFNPKSVHNARIGAWFIRPISKLYEIEWIVRNDKVLREEKGAVIVSNHQSLFDSLGLFNIWHMTYKMIPISKREIFYVWPFGLAAYLAGVVFINRSNPRSAYKQLQKTLKLMVEGKTKIVVYPEGTRNKDISKLLPFKKGAFAMAVAAQVPIIPMVFSPYYFINEKKYIFDKGHIIVQCMEPISTEGLTNDDIPELINKVYDKMSTVFKELTKEVIDSLPPSYDFSIKG